MKVTFLLLLSCLSVLAQNLVVLTHGAANTQEFQHGCPSNWPAKYFAIGKATEVPRELQSPPWIVETELQLKTRFESLAAEKEAWNVAQEAIATKAKRDRETDIRQAVAGLILIRDSSGTLTAAQLSNAVRAISKALVALIEEIRP